MKRLSRMSGVTLLEIMLVLAVAAMIIVMSIKYYNSAISSEQTNSLLQSIQAIQASEDTLAQTTGSYGVTTASGLNLPASALYQPWGGTMTISSGTTSFVINLSNVPSYVCKLVTAKFKSVPRYTVGTNCSTITYANS